MSATYLFSKSQLAFYPKSLEEDYIKAGTLPEDIIPVADVIRDEFNSSPPSGKVLAVDEEGMPAWADKPQSDLIEDAEITRTAKIDAALAYINGRQWPGKAALGRLTEEEKKQYGLWLDYLDALYVVDTSGAPNITWPITVA